MDSILYNQEVTADILNNMAVDLGNTSFNGFGTEKFGADELNKITADLVSSGILMSGERCKAIISNENIIIQPGIIVFANGAKKKITEAVSFPVQSDTYIYALNKVSAGTCELVMSVTNPNTDEGVKSLDFVPICAVDSEKKIIDMRTFSSANVAIPVGNEYKSVELTLTIPAKGNKKVLTYDMNKSYKYVVCKNTTLNIRNCIELKDGERSQSMYTENGKDNEIAFEKNGTTVDIYGSTQWSSEQKVNVTLEFI